MSMSFFATDLAHKKMLPFTTRITAKHRGVHRLDSA